MVVSMGELLEWVGGTAMACHRGTPDSDPHCLVPVLEGVQIGLFPSRLSQEFVNRVLDGNGFERTKHEERVASPIAAPPDAGTGAAVYGV
jgi:hypothetical protein